MPKTKTMRVLIEMPSNWWDFDSPTGLASFHIKQMVERQLKDALVEQYLAKVELPAIRITAAEIKDRMLTLLAERVLEERGDHVG